MAASPGLGAWPGARWTRPVGGGGDGVVRGSAERLRRGEQVTLGLGAWASSFCVWSPPPPPDFGCPDGWGLGSELLRVSWPVVLLSGPF